MYFFGIDLAWSPRNPSGIAVVRGTEQGGALVAADLVQSIDEIVDYIIHYAGATPALIAVDAPLWVPNEQGRRPGEAELARWFRRYEAGAHPANRRRLAYDGVVRGEALVTALAEHGFAHRPAIAADTATRQVTEVYPHPAMVAIFGLERTLKYKRRGPDSATHLAAWQRYQQELRELSGADPPLTGQHDLAACDVASLRGKALKAYEDRVDAVFCAYIALYGWRWGAARCRTFGNFAEGYIFTPVPAAMLAELPVDEGR